MFVKTAATNKMRSLLKASAAEHAENVKKARRNGQCADVSRLEAYDNAAFCRLIQGVDELIGVVDEQNDG